jgi:hypothetical protein
LGVSLLDQIRIPLRRRNTPFGLFLKGVQNINSLPKLYCRYYSVSIGGLSQRKLKNTRVNSFERLGVLRHPTELDQLQLVAEQFFVPLSENPEYSFSSLQATPGGATAPVPSDPHCYLTYIVKILYDQGRSCQGGNDEAIARKE